MILSSPILKVTSSLILATLISACSGSSSVDTGGTGCGLNCPTASTLELSWDANEDIEMVASYTIFMGETPDTVNTELVTINITDPGFSPEQPSVSYSPGEQDLGLLVEDQRCFQVYANNNSGVSAPSLASCVVIF